MLIFLSSLVRKICAILKVLRVLQENVRSGSLELGARDSSLPCSLSFLNRGPMVASFLFRVAYVICFMATWVAVPTVSAQPLLPVAVRPQTDSAQAQRANLNVQVRDLCFVLGARDNQLVGYGIVSGLAGDGDKDPDYTLQAVSNMLERFGLTLPPTSITSKNIAAVILTADIPPFVRSGSRIDVHISAMGDARSIHGAVLARTPLMGPDGKSMPLHRDLWQSAVLSAEYPVRVVPVCRRITLQAGKLFGEPWLKRRFQSPMFKRRNSN